MMTHLRLKNPLLLAALAAAYPFTGHAATAARVEFAAGSVVAVTASGGQRLLVKGSELQPGEMIRTNENARAQLKFADGALLSLQPETEFRIDEYKYDGKGGNPSDKSFFSLLKGGMRTITGLIGKANRDNYKVNTAVATIGIRGTEYSVAFTGGNDGTLNLATGEGAVEVCNAGGCLIVSGGDSAVVTGNNSKPTRTDTRPNLPPSSSTAPAATAYTTSENRNSSGDLVALGGGMVSGPGYGFITSFIDSSANSILDSDDGVTATFSAGSKLTKLESGNYTYTPGTVTSSFSLNGVIGWGTWTGGTRTPTDGYSSPDSLQNFHYVVGKPTSLSDLSGLNGLTASYAFVGGTNPTSSMGFTGSNVTGTLSIDFAGGGSLYARSTVQFQMNATAFELSFNSGEGNVTGSLSSMSGYCASGCTGSSSTSAKLMIAGANASHAAVGYELSDSAVGKVVGVAAFQKDSTAPTTIPQ